MGMLKTKKVALLIIDLQEKFRSVIHNMDNVVSSVIKLTSTFATLKLPILVTEQYPKGLGPTLVEVKDLLPAYDPIKKLRFSCAKEGRIVSFIEDNEINNLVVCGVECHVCVYQSVSEFLSSGYSVHLPKDAVSSRTSANAQLGIDRMIQAGALATSAEMVCFELLQSASHPQFKQVQSFFK